MPDPSQSVCWAGHGDEASACCWLTVYRFSYLLWPDRLQQHKQHTIVIATTTIISMTPAAIITCMYITQYGEVKVATCISYPKSPAYWLHMTSKLVITKKPGNVVIQFLTVEAERSLTATLAWSGEYDWAGFKTNMSAVNAAYSWKYKVLYHTKIYYRCSLCVLDSTIQSTCTYPVMNYCSKRLHSLISISHISSSTLLYTCTAWHHYDTIFNLLGRKLMWVHAWCMGVPWQHNTRASNNYY